MFSRIFAWAFLFATGVVSLAVITAAAGYSWGLSFIRIFAPRQSVVPSVEQLQILPADRVCNTDMDCTYIFTECSCTCGDAINKDYSLKYSELYKEFCKDTRPLICETECAQEARCVNNVCKLVDITAYDFGLNLQIYQSEQGSIFRYPSGWKVIDNIDLQIYAPEQSRPLYILKVHSDFSSLDEYIKNEDSKLGETYHCVTDLTKYNKDERDFIEYINKCYYEPTKVFAVMYQQKVIEAVTGYMPSQDEAQIILISLSYFKFKE